MLVRVELPKAVDQPTAPIRRTRRRPQRDEDDRFEAHRSTSKTGRSAEPASPSRPNMGDPIRLSSVPRTTGHRSPAQWLGRQRRCRARRFRGPAAPPLVSGRIQRRRLINSPVEACQLPEQCRFLAPERRPRCASRSRRELTKSHKSEVLCQVVRSVHWEQTRHRL